MEMTRHLDRRAVLAIVISALVLILPACGSLSTTGEGNSPQHQQLEVASAQFLYSHAEEKAREWKDDARLQQIMMSVHPVDDNRPLRASFIYRSQKAPDNYLRVTVVVHQGYTETETKEGEYTFPRPIGEPVELDEIGIDSIEALEITLQNGGAAFLSRNPRGKWRMSLKLMYTDLYASTGPVVWRALFSSDAVGTRYIRIDPESGEVVSVEDNPPRSE